MENEVRKAIHLEELDKVSGGSNLDSYQDCGQDVKCPTCGCAYLEPEPKVGYVCPNCGDFFTDGEVSWLRQSK